ncbi:MAG: septal ring lytic transglycosylase RlpA family protein [Beijerinckiaceae bacterium]
MKFQAPDCRATPAPRQFSALFRSVLVAAGLAGGLLLAGCAQEPQEQSSGVWRNDNTNEYFSQKRYGKASPRVIRNGRRIPKGGGRYLVGRPYKIAGKRYYPRQYKPGQTQVGKASWYGDAFHGRKTANGEIYDMSSVTAAHPTMPLPSYVRVTNLRNNRSIIVRVNDRGPYHGGRVIDLSKRVADLLDYRRSGTTTVKVEYLRPAGTAGSDDRRLVATLRTDGSPAQLDGYTPPQRTMIAAAEPSPSQRTPAPRPPQRDPAPQPAVVTTSAPVREPQETTVARSFAPQTSMPQTAPIPAARPLDLATIPGADTPIAASTRTQPGGQALDLRRVTFFAPFDPDTRYARKLRKRGPFDGIDLTGLKPLRRSER